MADHACRPALGRPDGSGEDDRHVDRDGYSIIHRIVEYWPTPGEPMDGKQFDNLTRRLAGSADRRSIAKVAAGAAIAMLTTRASPHSATAACPPDQVAGARGRCLCKTSGRPPGRDGCPCAAGTASCDGT